MIAWNGRALSRKNLWDLLGVVVFGMTSPKAIGTVFDREVAGQGRVATTVTAEGIQEEARAIVDVALNRWAVIVELQSSGSPKLYGTFDNRQPGDLSEVIRATGQFREVNNSNFDGFQSGAFAPDAGILSLARDTVLSAVQSGPGYNFDAFLSVNQKNGLRTLGPNQFNFGSRTDFGMVRDFWGTKR